MKLNQRASYNAFYDCVYRSVWTRMQSMKTSLQSMASVNTSICTLLYFEINVWTRMDNFHQLVGPAIQEKLNEIIH